MDLEGFLLLGPAASRIIWRRNCVAGRRVDLHHASYLLFASAGVRLALVLDLHFADWVVLSRV